jgi:hypothetical protein
METVSLNFRYLEGDYVKALRAHYASRLRLHLDIVVIAAVALFGAYEIRSGSGAFGIAMLSLAVLFGVMLLAAFLIIPRFAFRREPKFRDDYALTFSPDGIHFQTAHIDSQLQWNMYTNALVDRYSFVLYYGSHQFTVIPKRVFKNGEERETFERLMAQKISKITYKK